MNFTDHGIFVSGMGTVYGWSSIVLNLLLFLIAWLGRRNWPKSTLVPLYLTFAAFLASRMVVPDHPSEATPAAAMVFSLLSLVGFAFLARSLKRIARARREAFARKTGVNAGSAVSAVPKVTRSAVHFVLLGAFVYLVRSPSGSFGEFSQGVVAYMAMAATLPLLAFLFKWMAEAPGSLKPWVYPGAGFLVIAWLFSEGTFLMPIGIADWSPAVAKTADVMALMSVLMAMMSNQARMIAHWSALAAKSGAALDASKQEVGRLNAALTSIYEDNSALIAKQKEQATAFTHRVESLEKSLQIGIRMQRRHRLDELLQMIVELVRDNLGFKTVTLRLFNKKLRNFETQAYVGLSDEVRDTVVNYRIPLAEYQKMIEPHLRISNSYFIRNASPWYGEDLHGERSMLVEDTWGEIDMLLVPLVGENDETAGYLSVENPENPKLTVADVIESLESIAMLAVAAIRNARVFKELEIKNEKLRVYAEKLSSLNRMKSNFVATISHEFRTPLTSITAYCDTLLKNADDVDRALLKQFLVVIDEESRRLTTLIEDILDFSQMESGATRFERRSCDIVDLARMAIRELEKNFAEKNVVLHEDFATDGVTVQGERGLIKQLMVNLLHNAAKFTKSGGNVWLRVADENVSVRVTVEDEGIGIPDDQLEKIFEQFHQADNTSTRKYGGTGLGLAICRNIAEWHDGRIWVENMPGRGARFVIVLPKKQVVVRSHAIKVHSTVRRFEVERVLEILVESVAELMRVRQASLMLIDSKREELRIDAAIGVDEEVVASARVKLGEGISGKVAEEGRTMLVEDIETDRRVARSNNDLIYGSKSFLSVPIKVDKSVIGVVNVASPLGKLTFDEQDRRLLEKLVERMSVAIARLIEFARASTGYEQVREVFKAILEAKRILNLKDDDLITETATRVARRLGLTDKAVALLQYILHVYDAGLAKVGYHIINKPTVLSRKDRREIERHTTVGTQLLSVLESSHEVEQVVLHHHENYDGTGYPGKLEGEAIPIEARIVRVADSLKALISGRPYQRRYSLGEAMKVIKRQSGSVFDPKVVDAFMAELKDGHDGDKQKKVKRARKTVKEPAR